MTKKRASRRSLPREKSASDCWDWITPRQVEQLARTAFELAAKEIIEYVDEEPDPETFSHSRWAMATYMLTCFDMLLAEHAEQAGIEQAETQTEYLKRKVEIPPSGSITKLSESARYTLARLSI